MPLAVVAEPLREFLTGVELLRCQVVDGRAVVAPPVRFTGSCEFRRGTVGPGPGTESVEVVHRRAELLARASTLFRDRRSRWPKASRVRAASNASGVCPCRLIARSKAEAKLSSSASIPWARSARACDHGCPLASAAAENREATRCASPWRPRVRYPSTSSAAARETRRASCARWWKDLAVALSLHAVGFAGLVGGFQCRRRGELGRAFQGCRSTRGGEKPDCGPQAEAKQRRSRQ
jgi:hypothetical protein